MREIKFRWLAIEIDLRNSADIDFPLMSVSQSKGVIPRSELMGNEGRAESLDNYKVCYPGQIVINKMSASSGALGLARQGGLVSPDYAVLSPTKLITPEYLEYLMRSKWFIGEMVARLKGIGAGGESASVRTPRINISELGDVLVPLPEIEDQIRIVEYLDDQVSVIDRAIASKIRVLDLNEAAYMTQIRNLLKPPEDLGAAEIQGWVDKKVSWLFKTGSGTTPTSDKSEYFEGSIPWVNSGDLNDSIVQESKTCISETAFADFSALKMYPEGSLLVAMYGATVGKTGILGMPACVNQAVCALESIGELSTSFAHFWFLANRQSLIEQSVGGGQPNINQEIIRKQRISFPRSEYQQKIVEGIREISNQRKVRSEVVEKSIGLLAEYKNSLVTSAVTGNLEATPGKKSA